MHSKYILKNLAGFGSMLIAVCICVLLDESIFSGICLNFLLHDSVFHIMEHVQVYFVLLSVW